MSNSFQAGDKVRLSDIGKARSQNTYRGLHDLTGAVTEDEFDSSSVVMVTWETGKSFYYYPDMLELIPKPKHEPRDEYDDVLNENHYFSCGMMSIQDINGMMHAHRIYSIWMCAKLYAETLP